MSMRAVLVAVASVIVSGFLSVPAVAHTDVCVNGTGPQLTGVAAGVTVAVLGVWGLHVLTPGGGVTGSVGWVLLLLAGVRRVG